MAEPEVKKAPPRTRQVVLAEIAAASAALEAAKKAQEQEMVTDKKPYANRADPTGWLGYSEEVYNKFFDGYPKIAELIERYHAQIEQRYWVMSPAFKRRTMYRVLTGSPRFIGDAKRRSVNAPIQGISSEGGITAGYLIQKEVYAYMLRMEMDMRYFTFYCRAVHDATYSEEAHCMIIPSIHINQHVATVGVHEFFRDTYGFEPILDPEIELEIGPSDARGTAWNWVLDDLPPLLINTVDERIKDGYIKPEKRDSTLRTIFQPWVDKRTRNILQRRYPLMQVEDLEDQICTALERSNIKPER